MKKPYTLDFNIPTAADRTEEVQKILAGLDDSQKTPAVLEQLASYILYGEDEEGRRPRAQNVSESSRYTTYRTMDDKNVSLEACMEMPTFSEDEIRPFWKRSPYKKTIRTVRAPRFDTHGNLIDVGDADIPGMVALWFSIERVQEKLEDSDLPSYTRYRLQHQLANLRLHQYYLLDSYRPSLHFQEVAPAKTPLRTLDEDTWYTISEEELRARQSDKIHYPRLARDSSQWQRQPDGTIRWYVSRGGIDMENPETIHAILSSYEYLRRYHADEPGHPIHLLLIDFDSLVEKCAFTGARADILQMRLRGYSSDEILSTINKKYHLNYHSNRISWILKKEIPREIVAMARRERLRRDPTTKWKTCSKCHTSYPLDSLFFAKNRATKDGYNTRCKKCESIARYQRIGEEPKDRRYKDGKQGQTYSNVFEMPQRKNF